MKITSMTTVEELLRGGFTLTSPQGFELHGRPDDCSIAMRAITPVGMTAAGHLPLSSMGVYLGCNEVTNHSQMCRREDAQA